MGGAGGADAAALILAGGRGSRMGGVDKAALTLAGTTLLERAVHAARAAGVTEVVVAGAARPEVSDIRWVREEPAHGGPAAGIAAGIAGIRAPWTLILAVDLREPGAVASTLFGTLDRAAPGDGGVLVDASGAPQWLAGLYRTRAVGRRATALGDAVAGGSVRALLDGMSLARIPAPDVTGDIDTWDHLREARAGIGAPGRSDMSDRTLPPEALDAWAAALRERFGLSPDDLPVALILDLARDVATGVARPAAPFSAFVAGLVAGRSGGSPDRVREVIGEITALADGWHER
ncbi:NTP transferase domain-containing protein [Microbacterium sp. RD1]|uniref:NTP transferase domain-containing protein n=1 Tax=Microbacterium sp. RD1 TaxID=3457313 RepID=UPI003FA60C3E